MNEFITLIALLCHQEGIGHGQGLYSPLGKGDWYKEPRLLAAHIRQDTHNEKAACIRRLFRECASSHKVTGSKLPGYSECLVEKL